MCDYVYDDKLLPICEVIAQAMQEFNINEFEKNTYTIVDVHVSGHAGEIGANE